MARNNKRQRTRVSPQPSTSQHISDEESDASSESADSDYGVVNDRSPTRKKTKAVGRKRRSSNDAVNSKKKKTSHSANGVSSQKPSLNGTRLNGSQRKTGKLSSDNTVDTSQIENAAQRLVYFLLVEDQKKYPIKRKAILTHVFKDDYSPKIYSAVLSKANTILKKVYGMELMELENQKDHYLIVNILRRELGIHDYVEISRLKQQQHGLILFLLTTIFMNENVISEDELTKCLKPLGIDLTSKKVHPVFGDVKKYITTELTKQMYLNYECVSKDPPKYEFTWGLRAKQEFDKSDLLQFACQIMDDTSPEDWKIQFRDADAESAVSNADS